MSAELMNWLVWLLLPGKALGVLTAVMAAASVPVAVGLVLFEDARWQVDQ